MSLIAPFCRVGSARALQKLLSYRHVLSTQHQALWPSGFSGRPKTQGFSLGPPALGEASTHAEELSPVEKSREETVRRTSHPHQAVTWLQLLPTSGLQSQTMSQNHPAQPLRSPWPSETAQDSVCCFKLLHLRVICYSIRQLTHKAYIQSKFCALGGYQMETIANQTKKRVRNQARVKSRGPHGWQWLQGSFGGDKERFPCWGKIAAPKLNEYVASST